MNTPYVKKYNKEGILINPITKEKPYINYFSNRKQRNQKTRVKNNRKQFSDREIISRLIFTQRIMKILENGKKKFTGILAFHRNNK